MLPNITLIGEIFGNILDSILSIVTATDELANDFLTAVRDKTKEWMDSLNAGLEDGSLKKFFEDAAEEAKKWFKVVGNVFGGFKNLMNLTTGPGSAGEEMLNWFTEASEEFKNMFAEDPDAGKKFFKDAMVNARSVLGAIGAFIKEILGVADNPNIKVTFDTLAKAAPSFGDMLDKMIDAAPSFAELIVTIVEIANLLTDSDQISAFFDTLNEGAKGFKDFLQTPLVKKLLDDLGPIAATLSALGVLFDILKFSAFVAIGYIAFAFNGISKQLAVLTGDKGVKGLGGGFKNVGKLIKGAGIVGLIVLIITKITEFYDKFEDFRTMVDETVANVGESFSGVFEELDRLFENLFGGEDGGGLLAVLDPILKFLLEALIPGIGLVLSTLANVVETAISIINNFLESFMPGFEALFEAIGYLLEGNFPMFAQKLMEAVQLLIRGVIQNTVNGVIDLLNGAIRFINDWVRSVASGPLGQFFKEKFGIDLATNQIKEITKVRWVQDLEREFKNNEIRKQFGGSSSPEERRFANRNMALGGTVYPSEGGTIVRVAEAGRPERIEPLDANGLSNRDMALIQQLSGGGGATINVYPSAGMDERELAELVSRRIAFEVRKGAF
jgi:phage-related protein